MGSDVLIAGLAVVSAGVAKVSSVDSDESSVVVEGGSTVESEVFSVSVDVLDSSGVEASVSGLEERRVAVVLESVVGSSVELSMGAEEVGRAGDRVAVTPRAVVSAVSLGVSGSVGVEVAGVVPGTSVVVTREVMVSDGVVKGPSEVSVTSGVMEDEVVLVPGDGLPSSVVMAGSWWGLVPSVVPSPVEERRAEVEGGSMLVSTPNELATRAVLVPTDVTVVLLS